MSSTRDAMRILFGLQITQVVDVHRDQNDFWLKLNPLRPAAQVARSLHVAALSVHAGSLRQNQSEPAVQD